MAKRIKKKERLSLSAAKKQFISRMLVVVITR